MIMSDLVGFLIFLALLGIAFDLERIRQVLEKRSDN